jgi:2-keto-4-pentenoate hydratase/2-oxohepta-3-ene-1,7-dioic acid hydratase in catechol pathway
MKVVVFGADRRVGILSGEKVIDLNRADPALPADLESFIARGRAGIDAARRAVDRAKSDASHDANAVTYHAPWAGKRLAMMGGNFADHLAGMRAKPGESLSAEAIEATYEAARKRGHWGFWKVLVEVAGDGVPVPFPESKCEYFDYEGELAVVIGKRGKNIKAADIADYVWGVTLANDWSVRDSIEAPSVITYGMIKNFDMACSLGPCIVVDELDCGNVEIETRVNGVLRQKYNTRDMIFSFGEALEYLSRDFTFVPGDVICGGTAAGTAADRSPRDAQGNRPKDLFLEVGDVVEVSSPAIGKLTNEVVKPS